jgi:putative Flp pilus-assembly TadE/G-like protein
MKRRACSERGQASLVIIIFIGVFLLGATGLATDYTQIWTHRQMAQGAADAACQAGAADLYLKALDPAAESNYGLDFSWIGSSFDCSSIPGSPPCRYASLNGYSGSNVAVSFPSTVAGAPSLPPGFGTIPYPYIKVTITDPVSLSFAKLVSSSGTFNISAKAECGLDPISVPIPLVILHRTSTAALSVGGAATIKIYGGPNRSIQVNSTSATAVVAGTINLSQAGPGGTGADFAVAGGPSTKPTGVNLGSTGKWITGVIPSGDPWGAIPAPSVPLFAGTATPVPFAVNGCPDPLAAWNSPAVITPLARTTTLRQAATAA